MVAKIIADWKNYVGIFLGDSYPLKIDGVRGYFNTMFNFVAVLHTMPEELLIYVLCHELGHFCDNKDETIDNYKYQADTEYHLLCENRADLYGIQIAETFGVVEKFIAGQKQSVKFNDDSNFSKRIADDFVSIEELFLSEENRKAA